jgi:TRAP-type C4-dicarboxylate transport system permease small subunit
MDTRILWANGIALGVNALVLFLGAIKVFPPVLFLTLFVLCLAGLVWASWKIAHPSVKRHTPFHSAPTERARSIKPWF